MNSRNSGKTETRVFVLLLTTALLLSGCAVDRLKDLEVVHDLMQLDQEDAATASTAVYPSSLLPAAVSGGGRQDAEDAAEIPSFAEKITEEEVESVPEVMEIAGNKRSKEEIAAEDEAARQALGLDEYGIESLLRQNEGLYYFSHLDTQQKRVYAEIYRIITARGEKIKVSTLTEEDVDRAFQYVMADHPEIYYADGYTLTRYTLDNELFKIGFTARYLYDDAEQSRRQARLDDAIETALAGAPVTGDQYDTAKYVYDYVISHTDYEIGVPDNQNICSVFLNGASVCQGYSKAAQILLNRLGVEATLITGTVSAGDREGERHAWNLVRVNGYDYFMDVTWGDSSFQQAASEETLDQRINYDYLLDTTRDLIDTHAISNLVDVPSCTHMEDNYYVRDGAYFTGTDEAQLAELFDRAYAEGRGYVSIKCADESAYAAMQQYMITDRKLFDYLRDSGESASYSASPRQHKLTFLL